MSIDRKTVAEKIFHGTATPAVDFLAAPISAYSKELKGNEVLKYNPSKAKELWAKANAISPWSGEFGIAYNADGTAKNWLRQSATTSRTRWISMPRASRCPLPTNSCPMWIQAR